MSNDYRNMQPESTFELYEMFVAFLQAPTYHLALEAVLVLWVFWLLIHKSYKPQRNELTEREKEQLIAEWQPEPLVTPSDENHAALKPRTITGKVGKLVTVDGKECLNAATHNYLGLVEHEKLEEAALRCLRKYGVGSCGPRGFYGTVDIHLELEAKLAKFMKQQEAVLYSYGFSTISSAIPAYAKHGDVIFCDEGVNFAIQKGLNASRSDLHFFKHNDPDDLQRLLEKQAELDKANPKKAKVTRRFLVVEGIYMNYGDICPLPRMVELKNQYKVRLFIDEACSFGVLGDTGRGITEHFDIPMEEIDLITGTLEASIPGYGGFCVGTSFIVDHQRLSGLGYCFSASLPPLQAGVAIAALEILQSNPAIIQTLKDNCYYMHEKILTIPQLTTSSVPFSPIKHLYMADSMDRQTALAQLNGIVAYGNIMDKTEWPQLQIVCFSCQSSKKILKTMQESLATIELAYIHKVQIVILRDLIRSPSSNGSSDNDPSQSLFEEAEGMIRSLIYAVEVEANAFQLESLVKCWLHDCSTDSDHLRLLVNGITLRCDLRECFVHPDRLPVHGQYVLFPHSSAATKPNKVPVYTLQATCVVKREGLCESLLFGHSFGVVATRCWKMEWEDVERNHQQFQSLVRHLNHKDLVLVAQKKSAQKGADPTLPCGYFALLPSRNALLLKSLASQELMLPAEEVQEKEIPEEIEIATRKCLETLEETEIFNPLSASSGLYSYLSKLAHKTKPRASTNFVVPIIRKDEDSSKKKSAVLEEKTERSSGSDFVKASEIHRRKFLGRLE